MKTTQPSAPVGFEIDAEAWRRLQLIAEREGVSVAVVAARLLEGAVRRADLVPPPKGTGR